MKNLMFVCNGLGNGGAERVISVLSNEMCNKYNIYILTFSKPTKNDYIFNKDVQIIYKQSKRKGLLRKISKILDIRKTIKEKRINTVIAFSNYNVMSSVIASIFLKVRVIGSERNDPAQIYGMKKYIRNILYSYTDNMVFQTNDALNYFNNKIKKKSVVILNPLVSNLPEPYDGKRDKKIVTFCRLEPQKNLFMLIDAFYEFNKSNNTYTVEIYGDGSLKSELEKYIDEKDLTEKIKILPFNKNIHETILKYSMFVLTSDYEGLSNSMIEALAIGLPTIVTDCPCGGGRMVIDNNKNGILIPVGDSKAFAKAMLRVANDENFMKELSKNAVKIREKLNQERIADEWLKVIEMKGDNNGNRKTS